MKRIAVVAALLLCTVLLTGCGQRLTSGIVLQKEYRPRKTTTMMYPVVSGKATRLIPRVVTRTEKFMLLVQGVDKNGETVTEWWDVTKALYDAAKIGEKIGE